jgi:hypothetical protein
MITKKLQTEQKLNPYKDFKTNLPLDILDLLARVSPYKGYADIYFDFTHNLSNHIMLSLYTEVNTYLLDVNDPEETQWINIQDEVNYQIGLAEERRQIDEIKKQALNKLTNEEKKALDLI